MSDQNRWTEAHNNSESLRRDEKRYGRNQDDDQTRYGLDRERAEYSSFNRGDRFGSQAYEGGYAADRNRSIGAGVDRYGIPADYNFGGQGGGADQDRYPGQYGPDRYSRTDAGRRYASQPYRSGHDAEAGRGLNSGRDRYQFDNYGRSPDERTWWNQTRDEVSSWFGDDEAARRRQQDETQAGAHSGRGPKGYTRSDDRIREDVNDRLTDHGHLDASDIEVEVKGAEVTLNGKVHSREDKRRAEDIADRISGVKHVQNNLRVLEASGTDRTASFASTTTGSTNNQTTAGGAKAN